MNERLQHLEEKVAYLERHVTEQDKAMLGMGEDLARLRKQLLILQQRVTTAAPDGDEAAPADERPPHH